MVEHFGAFFLPIIVLFLHNFVLLLINFRLFTCILHITYYMCMGFDRGREGEGKGGEGTVRIPVLYCTVLYLIVVVSLIQPRICML